MLSAVTDDMEDDEVDPDTAKADDEEVEADKVEDTDGYKHEL